MAIELANGPEIADKQSAINSVVGETRKELNSFSHFFDKVKEFFDDPIKALQNLFTEVKQEHTTVETPSYTQLQTETRQEITSTIKLDKTKPLGEYTDVEAKTLFTSIFGTGLATDAFLYLTHNSPAAMKRTLALANHEGGFNFGIRNEDPNKSSGQVNYSTFQLSAKNLPQKLESAKLGFKTLMKDTPFATANFETVYASMNERQQNLALWLGHIMSRPQPYNILQDLSDPSLSDSEVATLMSRRIQGGIPKIGDSVVAQTKNATAGQYYANMTRHGYTPIDNIV